MSLVLASQSPRRQEILSYFTTRFEVISPDIVEKKRGNETIREYVLRNANEKCQDVLEKVASGTFVLAADTIVVQDEELFEKPRNDSEALRMLQQLSGQQHMVLTAVSLGHKKNSQASIIESQTVTTEVYFRALNLEEIQEYIATKEPFDKAGGYGAQGVGMKFIDRIEGSYSNVVGLPCSLVASFFERYPTMHIKT